MIGSFIQFFVKLGRYHKLKLFTAVLSAAVFAVVLFPYDDLTEVVSNLVQERTNGQVFLQFDKLGFQIFPYPALAIDNVVVESAILPKIQAERLALTPSISGFLALKPGFTAAIHRVWNGNIDMELKTGKKSEQGVAEQLLRLEIEEVDLSKVNETLNWPLKIQGSLSADTSVALDPTLGKQPEGDVQVLIKDLRFPPGAVPTPMGPIMLPNLKWSNIDLKGRLNGGKLQLERAALGAADDPINARLSGDIELTIDRGPLGPQGPMSMRLGRYDLQVDLSVSSKAEKDLSLFLAFIGNFRSATSGGSQFRFRVAGQGNLAPSLSAPTR